MNASVRLLAAAVVALALVVGACSDEGTSDGVQMVTADAQPYVEALTVALRAPGQDFEIDDEQATCIAEQWVEYLDPERLEAEGVDPATLEDGMADLDLRMEDGRALATAFEICGIDVRDLLVATFDADERLSEEERGCLAEVLNDDYVEELVATSIVHGGLADGDLEPAELAELTGPLTSCQDPGS